MSSPLEQLPQELKEQIMQHLGTEDLSSLGDTSQTMLLSVWAYIQPELVQMQQQVQAIADQTAAWVTDWGQYFGNQ